MQVAVVLGRSAGVLVGLLQLGQGFLLPAKAAQQQGVAMQGFGALSVTSIGRPGSTAG
jgi:hypothetical protein